MVKPQSQLQSFIFNQWLDQTQTYWAIYWLIVYATTLTELYIKSCYCNIKKKFQIDTSTVFLISYDMVGPKTAHLKT